jgi:hypothetical protein
MSLLTCMRSCASRCADVCSIWRIGPCMFVEWISRVNTFPCSTPPRPTRSLQPEKTEVRRNPNSNLNSYSFVASPPKCLQKPLRASTLRLYVETLQSSPIVSGTRTPTDLLFRTQATKSRAARKSTAHNISSLAEKQLSKLKLLSAVISIEYPRQLPLQTLINPRNNPMLLASRSQLADTATSLRARSSARRADYIVACIHTSR